jgi:hypothetical protein
VASPQFLDDESFLLMLALPHTDTPSDPNLALATITPAILAFNLDPFIGHSLAIWLII